MTTYELLLKQFSTFSKKDKYEKVLIYIHALQKSDQNYLGLYLVLADLWVDKVEEQTLDELFESLVSIIELGQTQKQEHIQQFLTKLTHQKEIEQKQQQKDNAQADDLLLQI